jgi:ankyrin repeat protein
MVEYVYQAIDLDRPAVRLLRLLKEGHMDDIQCELFDGWIGQPEGGIAYDALSYTWGSTKKDSRITVNGSTMYVTSNLYAALQHLRLNNQDRIIWIDAICINQVNDKERAHQVQHMSKIYKEAEQVIVWLGRGTTESDFTMDFMKQLQENNMKVKSGWRPFTLSLGPGRPDIPINRLREGMKLMLNQPWFRRIWILQEIANARVATIICGRKSVSARVFAQVSSIIRLQPEPHCQAILDIMPGPSRQKSWWAQKRNLYTLLLKFRKCEATDERDIIYALLGLSSDAYNSDILLPNYTKSIKQVIRDTTSFLLPNTNQDNSLYAFLDWTLQEFLDNLHSLSSAVLEIAAENGQEVVVRHLFATHEARANPWGAGRRTSLHRASYNGHEAVVRLLLENGAALEANDSEKQTPLFLAAANGHKAVIQLLLEDGAALKAKNHKGQTPLFLAATNGHEVAVRVLLESGADVNSEDEYYQTPILLAATNGHKAVVRLLIEKGAAFEGRDSAGQTPLLLAAANGNEEIVHLLLEEGAGIDCKDYYGRTPLSLAVTNGHKSIVRVLKGAEDQTRLFWAAKMGHETDVQLLLEKGVRLEWKNSSGQTALSWAAGFGREGIVRLLLKNGAEPDFKDKYGRTPLSWAARVGHEAMVRQLLEKGAELESKDNRYGRTPLSLAAMGGHHSVVLLLVAQGAELESRDRLGLTPVSWAARCGHAAIVQLLLERGADPVQEAAVLEDLG